MPNAAIIGAALTDASAHPWGLFLGSLDVSKEPGGIGIGVDPETITLTEAGPGYVSALEFTVDDPRRTLTTILAGTEVQYWDLVNNVCLFRGWVDHFGFAPDFGGQGRTITVSCVGIESILDWMIVPQAGLVLAGQYSVAHASGLLCQLFAPQLHAPSQQPGMSSAPYTRAGSFSYPIGSLVRPSEPSQALEVNTLTWTSPGGTLRAALQDFLNVALWHDSGTGLRSSEAVKALYTVDFYWNLRVWEDSTSVQPDDYTTLTVTDTYAGGPPNAAGLNAQVDWNGVIRGVYVAGASAAASGFFSDGTGIYGPTVLVTDSNITTAADASARAAAVIAQQTGENRGSLVLEDFTPTSTVHAGSLITITDAATSVATTFRITEIRKGFRSSGRQDWTVSFGALPSASSARLTRRFTRTLLS